ncbi:MAG: endonuclease/exonuclease/phosphatase family protein [Saprospiraceae bacterium]|nr:endonuclease/exonuclease/phosphatase family protein [Saprospiraceae bacterium]
MVFFQSIRYCFHLIFGLFFLVNVTAVQSQNKIKAEILGIGFYNLENLFDTLDDPETQDEEFTPRGAKVWTQDKYNDKIEKLASVIKDFGLHYSTRGADILGVCEIENRQVLKDLIEHPFLKPMQYDIIHHESFDPRGIDLAFIYKPKVFIPFSSGMVTINLTNKSGESKPTRGILMVTGLLAGQKVCLLLNHWPSRRGGEGATKEFRIQSALVNRHLADSVRMANPDCGIIIMGDLNDNPNNESVKSSLNSCDQIDKCTKEQYFNPFYKNFMQGEGTLAHNNSWHLFDQILFSSDFIQKENSGFKFYQNHVYRKAFMIEDQGHYRNHPKRTFSGDVYNYGYSDHFPVLVFLKKNLD